jgi:TolA protein
MRVFSERKIGQSGTKLAQAVFFSFLLHVLVFAASILMLSVVTPRTYIPPSYQVKLVGQPSDLTEESKAETAPAAPKKEEKARKEPVSRKAQTAISKQSKAALKKGAMPELVQKQKKAVPEPVQPEAPPEPAAGPSAPEHGPAKTGGTAEGVSVGTTSSEFKFPPYLAIVREKIEQNWNPPPSSKNVTAKVLFKILRSGRVDDPKLEKSSGQFYFDQAAIRAILLSNPFPPLPEGFYKDYEVFSVDLIPKD